MEGSNRLEKRGSWGQWTEFLFAYMGTMIGYGNVWRFPYVCYRNGGGAFLVPFIIAIALLGMPIIFLETLYSQYSNFGPGKVWEVCPLFRGIGLCMMMLLFVGSTYYTMVMAWTVYYLANSFSDPIPWSTCDNEWNTENCTVAEVNKTIREVYNGNNGSATPVTSSTKVNITKVSSAEEYWFHNALDVSPSIGQVGEVRWQLVVCLLVAWALTYVCLIKSIKSLGKVAYVASSLPFIILACLFIRGCLLPGSGDGLYFFVVPRWELLGSFTVWRDAATQMFYSMSLGSGATQTLASYNKFHNNCYRDSLIMPILDTITSLVCGLVIFSYMGYTAFLTGKQLDDVVAQGPGLVFVAYPVALSTLPFPQLWSVLFFLMLFTMGLDTQYVTVETFSTALVDCFPKLLPRKLLITTLICVVSFLCGLPLTTQAGVYMLNVLDWYIPAVTLLISSFLEVTVLAWIYGTDRLYSDVQHMIGYRPHWIFKYAWKYTTPALILFLWITGFVFFESMNSKMAGFDTASDVVGIALAVLTILTVPAVAIWELSRRHGPLASRIKEALKPTPLWRPAIYTEVSDDDRKGCQELLTV